VRRLLILGASSQVGFFLLPRLRGLDLNVVAVSRRTPTASVLIPPNVAWRQCKLSGLVQRLAANRPLHLAVCLTPLPVLPEHLAALQELGVTRLIAFSTTGRFYKSRSSDPAEQARVASVITAEERLIAFCTAEHINWTLFRPTMVYGAGRDGNIARIARLIRTFKVFPVVDGGRGLRQPVHADDLAMACVSVLDNASTYGNAYTLSGGSVVSYRQMVEAVFRQLHRQVRIWDVPVDLLRSVIAGARVLPGLHSLSPEMASRMSADLRFDHEAASRDFGFRPRPFALDDLAVGRG
jgi:nucleoside-diphosphate-sugar epimerase